MTLIDNVCFCKCHEGGQPRCRECKTFHNSKTKQAKTHPNDIKNPNIDTEKIEYRNAPNKL